MQLDLSIKGILSKDEIESNELPNILNKKEVFRIIIKNKEKIPIKIPKIIADKGVLKDGDVIFMDIVIKESEDPIRDLIKSEEQKKPVNNNPRNSETNLEINLNEVKENEKTKNEKENNKTQNKLVLNSKGIQNIVELSRIEIEEKNESKIENGKKDEKENKNELENKSNKIDDELIRKIRELKVKLKDQEKKEKETLENKSEKNKEITRLENLLQQMLTLKPIKHLNTIKNDISEGFKDIKKEQELREKLKKESKETEKLLKKQNINIKNNKQKDMQKNSEFNLESEEELEKNIKLLLNKLEEIKKRIRQE